ncbi:MAG: Kef-type K+ transport system membrane component KefB [Candidatus Omnitrophota bacterium]|jgi:Kef-type K+ transport system membrane component KefB
MAIFEAIKHILADISFPHFHLLGLLGLALFGGTLGGRLFQILRIPQVVGYIVIGIALGMSGLQIIDEHAVQILEPFNNFALGLIGFMIGGELKLEVFKKYGKQFLAILFFEGMMAFTIVSLSVWSIGSLLWPDSQFNLSIALLLGAIAAATAPAATTDVLWEYKTKGALTTTIFGIVAMDDALSLLLFSVASAAVSYLGSQSGEMSLWHTLMQPAHEVLGAISIALVGGLAMVVVIKKYVEKDKILALSLGMVLITIGLALTLKMDMLLASMTLGAVIVNGLPRRSQEVFKIVQGFTPPIYVLFFVLVGAKLNVQYLTHSILILTALYITARMVGKMSGAWLGAKLSGAPTKVRKYLPFCLFSQAGVAIGLSIVASHSFPGEIGNTIVIVVTASTFVVQLIGPSFTKMAVTKAGEVGLNITEGDLLKSILVKDIMDVEPPIIYKTTPYLVVLNTFSEYNYLNYPVIEDDNELIGIITIQNMTNTIMNHDSDDLFMAYDLMDKVGATIGPNECAYRLKEIFDQEHIEFIPVVDANNHLVGVVEERLFEKELSTRMMCIQDKANAV